MKKVDLPHTNNPIYWPKKYTLYLIKMKLLEELVDQFSSVNPPKRKFTNN